MRIIVGTVQDHPPRTRYQHSVLGIGFTGGLVSRPLQKQIRRQLHGKPYLRRHLACQELWLDRTEGTCGFDEHTVSLPPLQHNGMQHALAHWPGLDLKHIRLSRYQRQLFGELRVWFEQTVKQIEDQYLRRMTILLNLSSQQAEFWLDQDLVWTTPFPAQVTYLWNQGLLEPIKQTPLGEHLEYLCPWDVLVYADQRPLINEVLSELLTDGSATEP